MTNQEINIAIAEACGWTEISDWKAAGINGLHPSGGWTEVIPDYCNDLNAMHQAEMLLRSDKWKWLHFVNLINEACPDEWLMASIHATARQRAEAFLRTINLWIE